MIDSATITALELKVSTLINDRIEGQDLYGLEFTLILTNGKNMSITSNLKNPDDVIDMIKTALVRTATTECN